MQTHRQSVIEVFTDTFVGTIGSWLITYATFSNVANTAFASSITVLACTVWSLVRGYYIRRRFEKLYSQD